MTRLRGLGITVGALVLLALPLPARAHGIGGRGDLPVPLGFFVVGAASVLVITFVGLALLWPKPRLQELDPNRRSISVPGWRWMVLLLRIVGVASLGVVVVAGLFGADDSGRNPAPVLVWVVFWLVVPFLGRGLESLA